MFILLFYTIFNLHLYLYHVQSSTQKKYKRDDPFCKGKKAKDKLGNKGIKTTPTTTHQIPISLLV